MILLIILLILFFVIIKIVLYKEDLYLLFLVVLRLFYSIIMPGLFISLYLYKKLNFMARLVLGSVFTIALTSITSYYLGLIGLHIKYHPCIIPPVIMLLGMWLFLKNTHPKGLKTKT